MHDGTSYGAVYPPVMFAVGTKSYFDEGSLGSSSSLTSVKMKKKIIYITITRTLNRKYVDNNSGNHVILYMTNK